MKIIFLDHQGVMYTNIHPNPGILDNFNKNCVKCLNSILETDDSIEIVISSDWKYWVSLDEMKLFYKKQGILKSPIDYTIQTRNSSSIFRYKEIEEWLSRNNVTNWVVVDDLDMREYISNFVWISETDLGLCQNNIKEKILILLNNK